MSPQPPPALQDLRSRIRQIETGGKTAGRVLPFGLPEIDGGLPGGGLALGTVHEVVEGGDLGVLHAAAATLFVAGVLARMAGPVLWCLRAPDLFAPALSQVGLNANRVVYAESPDEKTVPLLVEEGLRHRGLAAVVGELAKLSMVASRRMQIAAEHSGVTAIILRRWRSPAVAAAEFGQPTAAVTRWRISALPSAPLPAPGIGRMRWRVELVRCRGGRTGVWEMEGCDEEGRLGLPAHLADGSDSRQGSVSQEPAREARAKLGA
ncbi:ImuA family protein [Azospirillum sp.]|uniref:ImuA family protein n=1 Tax=Azospirillum sp. TaxID=34012 RepID=UPI003D72634D